VSNEDDRPRTAGGYSDSGTYRSGSDPYSGYGAPAGRDPSQGSGYFDETGFSSSTTTALPGEPRTDEELEALGGRPRAGWHAGADIGLLALRLVVGPLFIAHGLQKLFGWFQGDGIDGTADLLAGFGYTHTTTLAWATGLSELVGGTFLTLGLFTPAGAAAILGVMANVIAIKFNRNDFAGAVELEAVYAAAAFALLFAGPGRVSLDRPTPWYRYAGAFGVVFLLIAAAAAVTVLVVLR
jgi:putative oxidoreductase